MPGSKYVPSDLQLIVHSVYKFELDIPPLGLGEKGKNINFNTSCRQGLAPVSEDLHTLAYYLEIQLDFIGFSDLKCVIGVHYAFQVSKGKELVQTEEIEDGFKLLVDTQLEFAIASISYSMTHGILQTYISQSLFRGLHIPIVEVEQILNSEHIGLEELMRKAK